MQGRTLATSNICNPMTSWKKLSLRRITFGTEVGGVDLSLFTIFPNFLIATGALFLAMCHKRCRFWCSVTIITTIAIITRLVLSITIIAIIAGTVVAIITLAPGWHCSHQFLKCAPTFWDNIPFPIDIYIQVGKTTSVIVESKFLLVRRFLQSPEASKVNHHHTQLVLN